MNKQSAIILSILALFLAPASWAQTATTTTSLAGIGDSNARPSGAWALPEGVVFARRISGYSPFSPADCAPPEDPDKGAEPQGAGTLVQLCLPIRHTGQRKGEPYIVPITVEIPPGVIFIADDISTQNGIVIKRFIVEVQPGQTVYVPLFMMCLNVGRSPSHPAATYQMGPLLKNPVFDALLQRLERKRITDETQTYVQMAIWALSEGEPIPAIANSQLDALPDA